MPLSFVFVSLLALAPFALIDKASAQSARSAYDGMIASHAAANGVPVSLVHRVIVRESRYRPEAVGRGGAMGMMQIKVATARGLGYTGTAQGLLDADTNLTYAVKYLAGAYQAAGGNHDRAVSYYASGYYYAAKRQRQNQSETFNLASASPQPAVLSSFAQETRSIKRARRAHARQQQQAGFPDLSKLFVGGN